MPSLQGDRDSIPTGEPTLVSKSPEQRVARAETDRYLFIQVDEVEDLKENWPDLPFGVPSFAYTRRVERYTQPGTGYPPEATAQETIAYTLLGRDATLKTTRVGRVYSDALRGQSTDESSTSSSGFLDGRETTISYGVPAKTLGTGVPEEVALVEVLENRIVSINPDGREPDVDNLRAYTVTRRTGGWTTGDKPSDATADAEEITVFLDGKGQITGGTRLPRPRSLTQLAKSGEVLIALKGLSGPDPNPITEEEATEHWAGLRPLVAAAKKFVENHPDGRLLLQPEDLTLVREPITRRPDGPLGDFVAKEVLRAI